MDNKASHVVQAYGAAILKEERGGALDHVSIFVVGSIQEEDCDGLGLRFALEESIQDVDLVCIGEATNLDVYRGQRGRMEIAVHAKGVSCHGSAPERGDNAIYRMLKLVADIEALNTRLRIDPFLGKGTCTVTHISCEAPSLCAVPDGCRIHIDRRLTHGEDKELAVKQILELPHFDSEKMTTIVLAYDTPSYKGKVLTTEKFYPTWVLPEDHSWVKAGVAAATEALGHQPEIGRWMFSTNGVSSMGQLGIPSIGFGPGSEVDAHSTNDRVKVDDLVAAMAFYATLPAYAVGIKP
jgi:putative selenium metabolism hydrolase